MNSRITWTLKSVTPSALGLSSSDRVPYLEATSVHVTTSLIGPSDQRNKNHFLLNGSQALSIPEIRPTLSAHQNLNARTFYKNWRHQRTATNYLLSLSISNFLSRVEYITFMEFYKSQHQSTDWMLDKMGAWVKVAKWEYSRFLRELIGSNDSTTMTPRTHSYLPGVNLTWAALTTPLWSFNARNTQQSKILTCNLVLLGVSGSDSEELMYRSK